MSKDDTLLLVAGLAGVGAFAYYMLVMKKGGEGGEQEELVDEPMPVAAAPEKPEFIGPYDECSRKQKCNCAACCVKGDCLKSKKSKKCPCAQVLTGIRQRQSAQLAAEEDIYSYYSSIGGKLPLIVA